MSRLSYLLLIFTVILTSCKPAKLQYKSYETVLMAEVLKSPEQYEGSKIELKGYITGAGGVAPLLFKSEKVMLDGKVQNAIHFNMTDMGQPQNYWRCDGKFVSLSGTLIKASSILTVDLILTDIIELKVIGEEQGECPDYEKKSKL